ncbi:DNA polymerase IV [Pseudonocardia sulfidoxydans NBRC 16205]|uniref:DNA polymerase IV n=1 Tax=Pseudonocardia sulfidoxydans NBRC 16205 TaxID=1223511 RepID=A0A511DNF3_9PSEU|nr:DNA polymerase IV [Pseudonocardia sulfidoxydans]GEL26342.1 DNA polymerase IV [Pseudonocardia sulfidoxydans NBRC 16205]
MTGPGRRWVLHLDMDAFYASVEQLTRPTLADRPVLVGGAGPRGVVAGASYQARVFGARSAMPMSQARRRCPHATVLPPRFELYKALSAIVMTVLGEAAPVLEPVSLDEAFLEPPALAGAGAAEVTEFGTALRAAVRERTGLPASVGAGSGKQLAKIASELAKPDGLRVVAPEEERAVLDPLPVRSLWGIGPVSEAALHRLGVTTIGQFAAMDGREVGGVLGSAVGTELHRLARGVDDRPVAPRGAAKQVSAETTFETDLTTMTDVHAAVARMAEAAHRRLVASGRAARTVTVKARTADFATSSRSETTAYPSTDLGTLTAVAQRLARTAVGEGGIRLIGVSLSGLDDSPPPALFDAVASADGWTAVAAGGEAPPPPESPPELPHRAPAVPAPWRAGDDVAHPEHGHGWVQGAGHGRVTVRFETRATGPGAARTLAADDPALTRADPLDSWSL